MIRRFLYHPASPWIVLFLFLSVFGIQLGGTNAVSRIAALRAMAEGGTLHIDNYKEWSADWALSPNGHYYSNKAPGGALLGFPVFALIDYPARLLGAQNRDALGRSPQPGYLEVLLLNLIMQIAPFAFLVFFLGDFLLAQGASRSAVHFFALAALFGNTAAIYMNTYFGHGLAALLFLGSYYFWLQRSYILCGLFFGCSALTDYGALMVFPFLFVATFWRERNWRPLAFISIGAFPTALVWAWYHTVAFGGPLTLPMRFYNPAVKEGSDGDSPTFLPSFPVLMRLLFGPERGILFTQPWILISFLCLLGKSKLARGSGILLIGGLAGLLWMNASVDAWHAGMVLGPRYLSLIFPAIALAFALIWGSIARIWQLVLTACLIVSVAFRIMVFPFSIIAPFENLWGYHILLYRVVAWDSRPYRYLIIAMLGFFLSASWAAWGNRRGKVKE